MDRVNILGTEYTIEVSGIEDNPILESIGGYTDHSVKKIILLDAKHYLDDEFHVSDLETVQKTVLRHEIIHAFLSESGLNGNGMDCDHWETNEEMIDWFALQFPKILKAFEEADCI